MMLSLFDVIELKDLLKKNNVNMHMVDACGSQHFTLDEKPSEEIKKIIISFFHKKGVEVRFIKNDMAFIVL